MTPGCRWFVYGKHPAAADYFSIGDHSSFALAYRRWVTNGYQQLADADACRLPCVYRFWSKGDGRQTICIGLLQASSDSLGRPYPLLILGTMRLPHWQKDWTGLGERLNQVWARLREIAVCRYGSVQAIADDLAKILPPDAVDRPRTPVSSAEPPNAVFTGGCGKDPESIHFQGPLTVPDFLRLWKG